MADRYVEVTITRYTANKLMAEDLAPVFIEKMEAENGSNRVKLRFGPFTIDGYEEKQLQLLIDFLTGLTPISTNVVSITRENRLR